jgi:hypothetical protein
MKSIIFEGRLVGWYEGSQIHWLVSQREATEILAAMDEI